MMTTSTPSPANCRPLAQPRKKGDDPARTQKALLVSPLVNAELPAVQQGLKAILEDTVKFYPFSFGLEGAHPFLYRQYWNEWNRFMVAREIPATELVENLEALFTSYYQALDG